MNEDVKVWGEKQLTQLAVPLVNSNSSVVTQRPAKLFLSLLLEFRNDKNINF